MYNTAEDIDSRIDQWLETKTSSVGDCLIWRGAWNEKSGYPNAVFDWAQLDVRRAIYNERVSLVGDYEVVYPTCGNSRCVNPDHLDAREMSARGRGRVDAVNRKARSGEEEI